MVSDDEGGYPLTMFRSNPRGRAIVDPHGVPLPSGRLVHIGDGARVHAMNPVSGRALCAPKLGTVTPAEGDKVTCYRCQHLMQINRTLRGSDLNTGDARPLLAAAREGRR